MFLTIKAGAVVTWTNTEDRRHAVFSDGESYRAAAVNADESLTFTFDKPGTYHCTCSIYPRMIVTIVVE